MNLFFKIRILVFLGLYALIPTNAISAEEVKVRFISFPALKNSQPIELALPEGETLEVELPTNSISKPYDVPAMSIWALGESVQNAEEEVTFKAYGKAKSIGSSEQLILVIRRGKKDSDGLILYPIDYSEKGFGRGQYYLVNASTFDIAGNLGTSKFSLKPGGRNLIAPKCSKEKEGKKYCYVKIYCRKNNDVTPFFTSTWPFSEKARSMLFFYQKNNGKLALHVVDKY